MRPKLDPNIFTMPHSRTTQGESHQFGIYQFNDSVILNRPLWDFIKKIDISLTDNNNLLIVGGMYSGKSLVLLHSIKYLLNNHHAVLLLDPCVEEGDIALTNILNQGGIPQEIVIQSPSELEILQKTELINLEKSKDTSDLNHIFPQVSFTKGEFIIIDISYYLERSHEAASEKDKSIFLYLYYQLIAQIIFKTSWLSFKSRYPITLVMDEVKLPIEVLWALKSFFGTKLKILSAVHDFSYITSASEYFTYQLSLSTPIYDGNGKICTNIFLNKL